MFNTAVKTAMMAAAVLGLSACGSQPNVDRVFESTSDVCEADASATRFVVRFKDGTSRVVVAESKRAFLDGFVSENIERIEYAEHDFHVRADVGQLTTFTASVNNWGVIRIEPDTLWSAGIRGDGVSVAVIDSGVDLNHTQLASQILVNAGEQGLDANGADKATNGKDDDGNGFIDDVYGYDFNKEAPLKGDHNYHGSHVAGIIAAAHNDTQASTRSYVQGVAPGAKILPVAFLDENGDGMMSDGVSAIKYAADRGVKVINASWGGTACSRSLRDEVAKLESRGIVFVTAAGNEGSDVDRYKEYPASLNLSSMITVGATGEQNYMAQYSNFGSLAVHIFAPGSNIISTVPGGMGSLSGTSMASPMVAGAVALLLSAEPTATAPQLRQALAMAAAKRNDYVNASQGRLNLRTALTELRHLMGK